MDMSLNLLNNIRHSGVEINKKGNKNSLKEGPVSNGFEKILDKTKTKKEDISDIKENDSSNEILSKEQIEEEIEKLDDKSSEEIKEFLVNLLNMIGIEPKEDFKLNIEELKSFIKNLVQSNFDIKEVLKNDTLPNSLKELLSQLDMTKDVEATDLEALVKKFIVNSKSDNMLKKPEVEEKLFQVSQETKDTVKDSTKSNLSNDKNKDDSSSKTLTKEEKLLQKLSGEKQETGVVKFNNFFTTQSNNNVENISKENMFVNKATFNQDIIKSIKYMNLNNIQELTVKINPKHLGELTINLIMDGEAMKAQLKSSNKDTFAMLNANVKEIMDKLSNDTMKIQTVEVSIYNEDTTYFNNGSENEKGNFSRNNKAKDAEVLGDTIEEVNLEEAMSNTKNSDDMLNVLV